MLAVHVVPVELPALDHGWPPGTGPEQRTEWRRSNRRQRCWRITYPDGTPTRTGLYVHYQLALGRAHDEGWRVVSPENTHGGTTQ